MGSICALSIKAFLQYSGQGYVYILFTIVSNLLLYFGFRKKAIFFDTFIGLLLWLGFWLKSSVRIAFLDGVFRQPTGMFDGSPAAFDQALLISACGLSGFLLASIIRERFIFNYPDKMNAVSMRGLFAFYQMYRNYILTAFVCVVVLVAVSNVFFGIYQRGEVPRTVLPFGLSGIYTWLLLFGLASVSALMLHFEFALKKSTSLLIAMLALLETFLSNVSMLSRGMILNGGALFYGALRSLRIYSTTSNIRTLLIVAAIFGILFVSSVFVVNHLRAGQEIANITVDKVVENNSSNKLADLILDRWVGIEGVMAVASSSSMGWDLWGTAWDEKFDVNQTSFFDKELITSPYRNMDTSKHHYVSLPGIIAFCFYPGSYLFLFISIVLAGLFAAFVELSAYKMGGRNVILCALIAQVIAYRYMSFGYVPARSYMLFGTIYLNLVIIFVAEKIAQYMCDRKSR
ncbi:hypothetical protein [Mariprofundus micogutta]|uniref:hypothetical protein n=1 Tax=Mariprofundus micogutta TaxID=1921010 RepID=UPI001D0FF722|nr:hypothetical protein [Mariprofundus micogutta]